MSVPTVAGYDFEFLSDVPSGNGLHICPRIAYLPCNGDDVHEPLVLRSGEVYGRNFEFLLVEEALHFQPKFL